MRRWGLIPWVAGAALLGAIVLVLDSVGALRPRVSADELRRKLSERWNAVSSYRADVAVKPNMRVAGGGSFSRQWVFKGKDTRMAVKDLHGFIHFQEWREQEWRYHQAGINFEATVQVDNLERLPYGRWALSRMPTIEDLAQVIREAPSPRVVGSEIENGDRRWIVTFQPRVPQPPTKNPYPELAQSLYREMLARPWRVWLSEKTGLPVRVEVANPGDESPLAVDLTYFDPTLHEFPPDWKDVNGNIPQVQSRFAMNCDALSDSSVKKVRARIDEAAGRWRNRMYQNPSLTGGRPPKPTATPVP